MLYLAGDNNLSDEMIWAIKEVYRVGAPPGVAVTVQFDPLAKNRSTRFYVSFPTDRPLDTDGLFPILHDGQLPDADTGDPETVADFIARSMKAAPAEYYMLILAGHGSGIVGEFLGDQGQGKPPGSASLSIPDLHQVFPQLRTKLGDDFLRTRGQRPLIDVLGMDTCLMSMAEVCSEIVGEVSYMVCSEGFDPNAGWPYFRFLQQLAEREASYNLPKPEEIVEALVQKYVLYYSDFDDAEVSVDMSALDVGVKAMTRVEASVARLVAYFIETEKGTRKAILNAIVLAHWKAQSYKFEEYTDLIDFCGLLRAECLALWRLIGKEKGAPYEEMAARCRAVMKAVSDMVKATNFTGLEFQHSHGLSVYFPWSRKSFSDDYRNTHFAARTGWATFLDRYLDETRRRPRARDGSTGKGGRQGPGVALVDGEITLLDSALSQPARFDVPSERFDVPSERFDVPSERFDVPSERFDVPSERFDVPSERFDVPSERFDVPSERFDVPSERFDVPSERFNQFMGSLMHDLPSKMRNPPNTVEPLVRLTAADRATLRELKNGGSERHRGAPARKPRKRPRKGVVKT
jgi:Clostripain family